MKKMILILVMMTVVLGGVFADVEQQEEIKKNSLDLSLESAYPLKWDKGELSEGLYMLAYLMIRLSGQYTFISVSDYLNLGGGIDIVQHPISLCSKNFFGGLGLTVYNDFIFNKIIVSPYVKSNFFLSTGKTSTGSSYLDSFVDLSGGLNLAINKIFFDVAYNVPVLDVTDDASEIHFNAQAVRFGVGYRI